MKVALVSADVFPTPPVGYGGLEIVVANLARHLALAGCEVTLYATPGSRPAPGVRLRPVVAANLAMTDDLTDFDAVHFHCWQAQAVFAFAAEHPRLRCVYTWHGPTIGPAVLWQAPPPNLLLCGVSRTHARSLGSELGCTTVLGVPNGVELDDYPLYDGPRDDYLLSLNRLGPEKGIDRCITMAAALDRPLRIAGPEHGVNPGYVQAILGRCDGRRVLYEGSVEIETKVVLLQRAAAVLWLGDFAEPFGLGIVEANACGTPVLALARGATPEVLCPTGCYSQGGFILDPLEGPPLNLLRVLPAPRECRANAERFSAAKMARRYWNAYAPA